MVMTSCSFCLTQNVLISPSLFKDSSTLDIGFLFFFFSSLNTSVLPREVFIFWLLKILMRNLLQKTLLRIPCMWWFLSSSFESLTYNVPHLDSPNLEFAVFSTNMGSFTIMSSDILPAPSFSPPSICACWSHLLTLWGLQALFLFLSHFFFLFLSLNNSIIYSQVLRFFCLLKFTVGLKWIFHFG